MPATTTLGGDIARALKTALRDGLEMVTIIYDREGEHAGMLGTSEDDALLEAVLERCLQRVRSGEYARSRRPG